MAFGRVGSFLSCSVALLLGLSFMACSDDQPSAQDLGHFDPDVGDVSQDQEEDIVEDPLQADLVEDQGQDLEDDLVDEQVEDTVEPDDLTDEQDVSDDLDDDLPAEDSLVGTSLEGIEIHWGRPLVLCNAWQENESLEAERERKVRIVLPPQERQSLSSADLARASVEDVLVLHGPLYDERVLVSSEEVTSELLSWEVFQPEGDSYLSAQMVHLLGEQGRLVEELSLGRSRDDSTPLDYALEGWEVRFFFQQPLSDELIPLETCDGSPTYEDAISVMVGTSANGAVVIRRYWRTPQREFSAGSDPVNLVATEVWSSHSPWQIYLARGFWAHTYSAQHHNFFEHSEVDFTKDLTYYHMHFRGWMDNGQAPTMDTLARVEMRDLHGWDLRPAIQLTWLTAGEGDLRTIQYTPQNDGYWQRVDGPALQRRLEFSCPTGSVFSLGYWWSSRFQVMTCPRDSEPGFAVVGLVPVAFTFEPMLTGVLYEGDAISEGVDSESGNQWFEVDLGDDFQTRISITETGYLVYVWSEEGLVDVFPGEPKELSLNTIPDQHLAFESRDGAVSVRMGRRWGAQGVGHTAIYTPMYLEMTIDEDQYRVEAWDRLHYTNTHHNWQDELLAESDELDLYWRVEFLFVGETTGRHYYARAVERESGEVLVEIQLFPVE